MFSKIFLRNKDIVSRQQFSKITIVRLNWKRMGGDHVVVALDILIYDFLILKIWSIKEYYI